MFDFHATPRPAHPDRPPSARRRRGAHRLLAVAAATLMLPALAAAAGTCTTLVDGLREGSGLVMTPLRSIIVADNGTATPNTGRLEIVGAGGQRRTLLDGLPSGPNDVGGISGPTGVAMRGRTVYFLNSIGDVAVPLRDANGNRIPGFALPNPAGPSSPLMSSLMALHLSAAAETSGASYALTPDDHQRLAAGETVVLSAPGAGHASLRRVADFPDYIPAPLPPLPGNIRMSNPFGLALAGDLAFVTDGGRNLVWRVELDSGAVEPLVEFPNVPNPLFGIPGLPPLPSSEAVPTGIAATDDGLLVALFTGVPFSPGVSTIQRVHPVTATSETVIGGGKTLIGVQPLADGGTLALQHAAGPGPFFGGPGRLLRYHDPAAAPEVVADCLTLPVAMTPDRKGGRMLVTDLGGRIVAVKLAP